MPSEFNRQPKSLDELDRWKATEFRQFVLYIGPVVLRGVVSEEVYRHFMALSVGLSIMLDSNDTKRMYYLEFAKDLINYFVDKGIDVGKHSLFTMSTVWHIYMKMWSFSIVH